MRFMKHLDGMVGKNILKIDGNQGLSIYPPLWSKQSKEVGLEKCSRKAVHLIALWELYNYFKDQLGSRGTISMNKQIQKHEVIDLLLKACPSYLDKWEEHKSFYGYDEGEEQLIYLDMGDFVHHLIELYKKHELDEFPTVFDVIEKLLLNGNHEVKELAVIGALEGLQNVSGNNAVDPNVFLQFLMPESLKWWNKLNDYWEKGTLLTDE